MSRKGIQEEGFEQGGSSRRKISAGRGFGRKDLSRKGVQEEEF